MGSSRPAPDLPGPLDRLSTLPAGIPDLTLGWEAVAWASRYLIHPNGTRAGQRWEFIESQVRFLLHWYAIGNDGRWLYSHGVRRLAKGSGKALALDTPIPTPAGWTTMGEIEAGSLVLDEHGSAVRVLAASPVMHERPCYRLAFRDGTEIVADAEHLWPLDEFVGGRKRLPRVVSTADVAAAGMRFERKLTTGITKCSASGVARWKTMPTPSLDLPDAAVPMAPYLLGYWLGDGDSDTARITVDERDLPELSAAAELAGMPLGTPKRTGNPSGRTYRVRFGGGSRGGHPARQDHVALLALRGLGVLRNKHIPPSYMRASRKQRMELLRGLMDSDGSADKRGRIELCLMSRQLAADCVELMRTLGLYPRMTESDAVLRGVVVGRRWRINVTAFADEPIFGLQRKVARLPQRGAAIPYSQVRTVTAADPAESVPVRCITVDSESGLFLAGDGLIPTHNSPFAAVMAMLELLAPVRLDRFDADAPGGVIGKAVAMPLVQIAATSENQTQNTMRMVRALTAKTSKVVREYKLDPGKTVIYTPAGGQLEVITSSASAAEGAEVTFCVEDEVEHWRPANGGTDLAAVIDRNLAKSGSRGLETCNAWEPGAASAAEGTWDAWVAQEEGRTRSGAKILYDALIAPPDTDLADDDSLRAGIAAAYGDCYWVDQQAIFDRILSLRTSPDVARRFYLNQPVASLTSWVTPQEWSAIADPSVVIGDGDEIVAFFDGSKSNDATALIGCHVETGHVFALGVWEPQPAREGGEPEPVPVGEVDEAVERMFLNWDVKAFFADVREWESFTKVEWPKRYADQLALHSVPGGKDPQAIAWDMRTRVYDFTMACEMTLGEILERGFTHDGDSRVARHMINARRHPNRWGVSIGKETRQSPKKIDAAVCVIGARMVRRLYLAQAAAAPEPKKKAGRVWGFA